MEALGRPPCGSRQSSSGSNAGVTRGIMALTGNLRKVRTSPEGVTEDAQFLCGRNAEFEEVVFHHSKLS